MNVEMNTFQRRTYNVQAVRVTPENLQHIAGSVKGEFVEGSRNASYVKFLDDVAFVGDWVVQFEDGRYETFSHEDFVRDYQTHAERENKDEKYAKIYARIKATMTTQQILDEL